MRFTIPQSSLIIEIVKIRFRHKAYFKAKVNWIDKSSGKTIHCDRNLKIPKECFQFWERIL